jgi:ZIP family zinc transporter
MKPSELPKVNFMDSAARSLKDFLADPRHARTARRGSGMLGVPLAAAIAIQDFPEGLVVAVALRTVSYAPWQAAAAGAPSGRVEPLGAIFSVTLTSGVAPLYPIGLGFAAGAMIWVVSHEIIPETHRQGHEQAATLGLIGGLVVMIMFDTALG